MSELKLCKSHYVVLGLLAKMSMSGYDIKQVMSKLSRFYWSESNAQIYPILKKLETAALVTSQLDESSGARQKRMYEITKQGREKLQEWLASEVDPTPYREELLLRLSFGQFLPKEALQQHFKRYKKQLEAQLEDQRGVMQHIQSEHFNRPDQADLINVYDHVRIVLEAKLAWVESLIK